MLRALAQRLLASDSHAFIEPVNERISKLSELRDLLVWPKESPKWAMSLTTKRGKHHIRRANCSSFFGHSQVCQIRERVFAETKLCTPYFDQHAQNTRLAFAEDLAVSCVSLVAH